MYHVARARRILTMKAGFSVREGGYRFHVLWSALHASAALLAFLAVLGHVGSAAYHWNRRRGEDYELRSSKLKKLDLSR